jgi:hypothetical protein
MGAPGTGISESCFPLRWSLARLWSVFEPQLLISNDRDGEKSSGINSMPCDPYKVVHVPLNQKLFIPDEESTKAKSSKACMLPYSEHLCSDPSTVIEQTGRIRLKINKTKGSLQ